MSKIWYLTSTCMQFNRIRHSYVAVYMWGRSANGPWAVNSYTWCYVLVLHIPSANGYVARCMPMLAMHHHNVHNWITARFLFYAQVSSLVLRFNSRLKTPLSGLCTSSATWTALYMEVWPSLYMKKKNILHIRPWCIGTICNCARRADLSRKSERCVSTRGRFRTLVDTNLYPVDIQW
jgi:hypothetical protein